MRRLEDYEGQAQYKERAALREKLAAALARAERAEDAADELTRCNATQFDVISSLTHEAEGLRAELAQARTERDALRNNETLCHECGHTDTEHADDVDAECRIAGCFCGGFISAASVARLSGREKAGIEVDLAACRATLRELAEVVRKARAAGGYLGIDKVWVDDLLARAEEEGKRDG